MKNKDRLTNLEDHVEELLKRVAILEHEVLRLTTRFGPGNLPPAVPPQWPGLQPHWYDPYKPSPNYTVTCSAGSSIQH